MSEVSADDRDLAIRTMLGEEGSDAGQAGVAAVILNRLAAGSYGGSVGDVVLAPNQFEAWTRQSDQLLGVRRDDPRYVAAGQLFDAVRDGSLPDPTNGATHFYAPVAQAALGRQAPGWAQGRGLKLGSSMFYAPQGRVDRKPDEPGFKVDFSQIAKSPSQIADKSPSKIADKSPSKIADKSPSKIADKSPSQIGGEFPSDQLPPGATPFQLSSPKAASKAAEFPIDRLPPGAKPVPKAAPQEGADEFSDPITAEAYRKAHEPLHDRRYPSPPSLPGAFMGPPEEPLAGVVLDPSLPIGVRGLAAASQEGLNFARAPFEMTQEQAQRIRQGNPLTPQDAGSVAMNAGMLGAREAPGGAAATRGLAPDAGVALLGRRAVTSAEPVKPPAEIRPGAPTLERLQGVVDHLKDRFSITAPITVVNERPAPGRAGRSILERFVDTKKPVKGTIYIDPVMSPEHQLAVLMHEFGHTVQHSLFDQLPEVDKAAILDAWKRDTKYAVTDVTSRKSEANREFVKDQRGAPFYDALDSYLRRVAGKGADHSAGASSVRYDAMFDEWFANQTSKFLTTNREAVTSIDKFFKGIADLWKQLYETFTGRKGSVPEVEAFLRKQGRFFEEDAKLAEPPAEVRPGAPALERLQGVVDHLKDRFSITIRFRDQDYSGATKLDAVSAAQRATGVSLDRIWDEVTPERQERTLPVPMRGEESVPHNEDGPIGEEPPPPFASLPGDLGAAGAPPGSPLPDRPTREMVWEQEDLFNRLAKAPWADKSELLNSIDSWPKRMKTAAAQERLYRHMEDPSFPLTAQERADYEQYIAPLKREELALWEEARKTDLEGIEDFDPAYAHRMVKKRNPQFDRPLGIGGGDEGPLGGQGRLPMSTSSMKGRVFFAIQDVATGERKIVARDKDGNMRIIEPGRPAHPIGGADIKIRNAFRDRNGRAWTLEQARTDEIEAATGLEYYKSAGANTIDNIVRLRQVVRAIHEVERLKKASPEWAAYARKIGERGTPRGWRVPKMPLFHGWRVHPRLADVIDDFYGHEPGTITENLAKINRWTVGTMFWSPVTHIVNVGTHWFTARGWDNVTPHGMLSLAVDGARAFREVAGRGKKYQELLRDGSGLLYASTSLQKFSEMMLKRLGEDVVRNPARWDPIARTLGVGPSDLVRMIYEGSSRILWSVSDMFMMQRVLELERKGMSTRQAIEEAERHIPNYRAHSEILGKRIAAQVYFHPLVTQFSRYHYGQLNSWANIAKDAVGGGKDALGRDRRLQALGNVMATGVMMVFVAPLVNEELKKAFGSKVRLPARGSTTLAGPVVDAAMQTQWAKRLFPKYVRDYYNDDSNLLMTAQNLFAIAPITRAFGEFATNLDWFSGRRVAEPAEASDALHSAAKGQPKQAAEHAARFGLQEAEHAGERVVQPLSALSRIMQGDKGLVKGLIEQGLGLTEPNTAGIAAARRREESEAGYRRRHPRGPLEELGGRLPF